MDINQELESTIRELDRLGKKESPLGGGSYGDWVEFQQCKKYILDTFLKAFRGGMRLSPGVE